MNRSQRDSLLPCGPRTLECRQFSSGRRPSPASGPLRRRRHLLRTSRRLRHITTLAVDDGLRDRVPRPERIVVT